MRCLQLLLWQSWLASCTADISINDDARAWTSRARRDDAGATYELKFALLESSNPPVERERISQTLQSILSDIEQLVSRPGDLVHNCPCSMLKKRRTGLQSDSHTVPNGSAALEINRDR